ncbi:MAG: hypothetical protein JO020_34440 [Chloroflexi bacterium]|nr:hypothetical protein [Chloroflexota bacterium]
MAVLGRISRVEHLSAPDLRRNFRKFGLYDQRAVERGWIGRRTIRRDVYGC